jgi:serine/threonine protein kinase/tetratricopeptide (TPR) repeat protein/TolB-like protein
MPESWEQIKEIVASALEQSPAERSAFLRQACGENEALRSEVESLLVNYGDSFLETSPSPVGALASTLAPMIGKKIGAYRIVGRCGQGGMAVVYLGERDDQQFRKRVAIKMLSGWGGSEAIRQRFVNERQTLASLDHPNIVKLLDGGSTEDGLPYLVMDFVDGIPIDRYCDRQRLSIPERLELFRTVCAAVHYAHDRAVIHRDLKPGNILITGDRTPRLLDFGIAKLLNPEFMQAPLVTQSDFRPMTPDYASPEQVRGETVTHATDIYSLGVLLYELLTGHRPYRVRQHSFFEFERLVCEVEPELPSSVIERTEERGFDGATLVPITPELVTQARRLGRTELRRRLRGDLDNIVMKALRKEPRQRYPSVREFSDDLERHLKGIPVRARKPTLAYRGGRFFRRHRESSAAVLAVLALVLGLGSWQLARIRKQTTAEERQGIRARRSVAILGFKNISTRPDTAWISTALSEMLTTELAAGGKLRTIASETVSRVKTELAVPNADTLASATLERLGKNLGSDFVVLGSYLDLGKDGDGQIRLDIRVQDTANGELVAAQSETGTGAQLAELVSRAGARLREQFGIPRISPNETAGLRASMPSNPEAMRLYAEGLASLRAFDAMAARKRLRHAVEADPSYPLAHSALAKAWLTLGYDQNALQEAKLALDLSDKLSREDHLLIEGRYYETSRDWPKAIETYRVLYGFFPDNLEYGLYLSAAQTSSGRGKGALGTLAQLGNRSKEDPRIDLGISEAAASLDDNKLRVDAAEAAASKAKKQGAKLLVARARNLQCRALANLGENEKAIATCEEGKRLYAEAGDRGGLARTLQSMAEVPINQGDFIAAEKLYREVLAIARAIGDQSYTARALNNLGVIAKRRGDFATALKMYGESLQLHREMGNKSGMAAAMGNTGNILSAQGKVAEALKYYQDALELSDETGLRSSSALALKAIGDTLIETGDLNRAHELYQKAAEIAQQIGDRTTYATTLVELGTVAHRRGQLEEARKVYLQGLSIEDELKNKGDAADARLQLAELACDSGKPAEAESLARSAVGGLCGQQTNAEIFGWTMLSRSLLQQGRTNEAQGALESASRLSKNIQDVRVLFPLAIALANLLSARKDVADAEKEARQVLAQTRKLGLFRLELEAALALGEIMKTTNPAAARAQLDEVAKKAKAKGFGLIARAAAAAKAQRQSNP